MACFFCHMIFFQRCCFLKYQTHSLHFAVCNQHRTILNTEKIEMLGGENFTLRLRYLISILPHSISQSSSEDMFLNYNAQLTLALRFYCNFHQNILRLIFRQHKRQNVVYGHVHRFLNTRESRKTENGLRK